MAPRGGVIPLVLALSACSDCRSDRAIGADGGDAGALDGAVDARDARADSAAADLERTQLFAALPRSEDGLPVLLELGESGVPGLSVQLAYDETIDDAITRWGACMAEVARCVDGGSAALAACVASIAVCDSAEGGEGCCPDACVRAFDEETSSGTPASQAIQETFVLGDCVEGFATLRDAAIAGTEPSP